MSTRVDFANTLRGFAALAVVISHYYGVFWLNRSAAGALINSPELPLDTYPVPNWISWLHMVSVFNWGAYGVALFFIISGFVIPFSLDKMGRLEFLVGRVFRIIPVYFVGFTISLLALLASTSYFSREWPFGTKEIFIHYIPGIRDVLWSRGIDGIIWTLEIEMKFYLICAASISWFHRKSLKIFLIPIALFVLAVCVNRMIPVWGSSDQAMYKFGMVYMTASQYIIYMYIGVVFYFLYSKEIKASNAYLGIGCLFIMFCLHWWVGPYSTSLVLAWSYAFALLTFSFAYLFPNIFRSNPVFDFLANISYPLYVIHGVAGYVAIRLLLEMRWWASVTLAVVTAIFLFSAWLIHVGIEKPAKSLRRNMTAKWSIAA